MLNKDHGSIELGDVLIRELVMPGAFLDYPLLTDTLGELGFLSARLEALKDGKKGSDLPGEGGPYAIKHFDTWRKRHPELDLPPKLIELHAEATNALAGAGKLHTTSVECYEARKAATSGFLAHQIDLLVGRIDSTDAKIVVSILQGERETFEDASAEQAVIEHHSRNPPDDFSLKLDGFSSAEEKLASVLDRMRSPYAALGRQLIRSQIDGCITRLNTKIDNN